MCENIVDVTCFLLVVYSVWVEWTVLLHRRPRLSDPMLRAVFVADALVEKAAMGVLGGYVRRDFPHASSSGYLLLKLYLKLSK